MPVCLKLVVSVRHQEGIERVRYCVQKILDYQVVPGQGQLFDVSDIEKLTYPVKDIHNQSAWIKVSFETDDPQDLERLLNEEGSEWKKMSLR